MQIGCGADRSRRSEGVLAVAAEPPMSRPAIGFHAATPCRGDPEAPEPVRKVARNAVGLRSRDRTMAAPPGLPRHRRRRLGPRLSTRTLAGTPAITGPSWKEELLRPPLVARRGVVSRPVPLRPGGRLIGEASPSYLFHPLAPERARAGPGREARRPPPRPRRPRTRSTSTRSRSAGSRSRSRTRWRRRTTGRAARSSACSQIPAPSAVPGGTTPTPRAGSTPSSSSDGSQSSREQLLVVTTDELGRGRARHTRRSSPSSERAARARRLSPRVRPRLRADGAARAPPSRPASPSRTGGSALLGRSLGWAAA